MPRHDPLVRSTFVGAETLALVQLKPTLRVLAVSPDRALLVREMGVRLGEVREQRGAPLTHLAIQPGVMHLS